MSVRPRSDSAAPRTCRRMPSGTVTGASPAETQAAAARRHLFILIIITTINHLNDNHNMIFITINYLYY